MYVGYPNHKYFRMSYVWDIQITNILECHMYGQYGISKSQVLYQGYSMDSLFQSARGPCRLGSLAAPSGPGSHCPLRTILCHCDAPLLSLSHRQAPQTRFAPPKLPQPLVDLISVASLPARLVGCIGQPIWKPGAPVLAELVWDGRRVA